MRTFSIILADDEQNILYGMQKGINWEELGFIVAGTAQNGKEVLEMMDDLHPDLVISDIKMPFMDGLELAKTIHENYMNTKVILFSGWDDFEYARLAISYGVSEYLMKPIDYDEMKKLLVNMHQTLEEEYNEKLNWTRLEYAYLKSLPLLRQQFFTQLVLGTMELDECHQQIKNLGLELDNKQYCIIAVKIQKVDHNDVFSALSIKETLKEALDKISKVYEFGIGDKEIFLLTGDKKHEIGKISRSIQEASIMITRIFGVHISCGMSENTNQLEDIPTIYTQAKDALEYNLVVPDESYTYYNDLMLQEEVETDWNTTVEQIGKTITYCDTEELKEQVDDLVNVLHQAHYNLNEYQMVIMEISFIFARLYKKYHIVSNSEFEGSKKMAVTILSLTSGEELDQWLLDYCQLIRLLVQKKRVDNNVILVDNAKKIVEEHFSDPDLSVRVILPVVMSVSIGACIISSMMLFSYLFSSYFKKDAIEKMDRQTISLAQSLENEVSEVNSLVNDIYYQNIKKYDCENVQFKTVMTQKITNESNRIYSISLYDMNGNRVWSFGESSSGFDNQQSWFENAKKNTETTQYGHRHLVKSDLSGYVMDISRYVEYINAGNIRSGILLMQYYTEPIEGILDRYQNQKSAYCYLTDESKSFIYHPFEKRIASGLYKEKTVTTAFKNNRSIHNGDWLVERKQIGYTGWNIVVVNSMSNLLVENRRFHYIIWFILLLVGAILILLDFQVFRNFTDPVYQLLATMEDFGC